MKLLIKAKPNRRNNIGSTTYLARSTNNYWRYMWVPRAKASVLTKEEADEFLAMLHILENEYWDFLAVQIHET